MCGSMPTKHMLTFKLAEIGGSSRGLLLAMVFAMVFLHGVLCHMPMCLCAPAQGPFFAPQYVKLLEGRDAVEVQGGQHHTLLRTRVCPSCHSCCSVCLLPACIDTPCNQADSCSPVQPDKHSLWVPLKYSSSHDPVSTLSDVPDRVGDMFCLQDSKLLSFGRGTYGRLGRRDGGVDPEGDEGYLQPGQVEGLDDVSVHSMSAGEGAGWLTYALHVMMFYCAQLQSAQAQLMWQLLNQRTSSCWQGQSPPPSSCQA